MSTDLIEYDSGKIDLIKRTVAKGASDDELALFLHACKRTGLDPFMKQIHAIKRWSAADQREIMAIQTGIDGYRLIAERTGKYAGSDEPVFEENGSGHPVKATVTVWKLVEGARCPFTASARWEEYVQKKKDGAVTSFWSKMPYGQLGKCAEALALRKAFPAELSGVYTHEEMQQADNPIQVNKPVVEIPQIRPPVGNRDFGLTPPPIHSDNPFDDPYQKPSKQADNDQHGEVVVPTPPVKPATLDAPASKPQSAADFAMQQAEKVGANEHTVIGFIGSFAPYQGTKAFQKGAKPGFFDVETEDGQIAVAQVRYFDPKFNAELNQPGPLTITYTSELYQGKTQYKLLRVQADIAED